SEVEPPHDRSTECVDGRRRGQPTHPEWRIRRSRLHSQHRSCSYLYDPVTSPTNYLLALLQETGRYRTPGEIVSYPRTRSGTEFTSLLRIVQQLHYRARLILGIVRDDDVLPVRNR